MPAKNGLVFNESRSVKDFKKIKRRPILIGRRLLIYNWLRLEVDYVLQELQPLRFPARRVIRLAD